jgi:Fuc2NAc and GlcNAc transferase
VGGQAVSSQSVLIAVTVFLSWILTGLATWYAARRGLIDQPGERHSHSQPTPRGGGAGLVLALVLVTLLLAAGPVPGWWKTCVMPGVVVLALLGWWDDHHSLGAGLRFIVQLAVSLLLLACAVLGGWMTGVVTIMAGGLFILWMTNLYNFMDGSNGMAGLQGVFAGLVLAWLYDQGGDPGSALVALLLAAVCVGFLPWNLGRARVFMGDVGSLVLGFALAALLLHGVVAGAFSLPVALLVVLVFLVDATLTLLARVLAGEQWYNPHRQHLYQRLIARGWTHGRVAALYQAVNLMLIVPGVAMATTFPALGWSILLVLACALGAVWYGAKRKLETIAGAG